MSAYRPRLIQTASHKGYRTIAGAIVDMNSRDDMEKAIKNEGEELTIVFDIDNTLSDQTSVEDDEILYIIRKSMLIFADGRKHHVLPGVIELMQFLFSKDNIKIAFFSSCIKKRNTEFVKELLIRALGPQKYQEVAPSIVILSEEDLTPRDKSQAKHIWKNFGLHWRSHRKDITKALGDKSSLNNAIFVDNDPTFIHYGQEKNYLRSPNGRTDSYNVLRKSSPNKDHYKYNREKLFFKFNSVFYIAGVLSDCIIDFEKRHDLTKRLFDMHFGRSSDKLFGFKPGYDCLEDKEYYAKGLACLSTVNPKLCFVSQEDYMDTLRVPATKFEQQIIDDSTAPKNRRVNGCMM